MSQLSPKRPASQAISTPEFPPPITITRLPSSCEDVAVILGMKYLTGERAGKLRKALVPMMAVANDDAFIGALLAVGEFHIPAPRLVGRCQRNGLVELTMREEGRDPPKALEVPQHLIGRWKIGKVGRHRIVGIFRRLLRRDDVRESDRHRAANCLRRQTRSRRCRKGCHGVSMRPPSQVRRDRHRSRGDVRRCCFYRSFRRVSFVNGRLHPLANLRGRHGVHLPAW